MRIRRFEESDFQNLYETISDPEVMKYIENPYNEEQTWKFLQKNGLGNEHRIYAAENDDGTYVGYVIFHDFDEESVEIGWLLKREEWGKGYAKELTRRMIAKAKAIGKQVVIECLPEQVATRHLAESFGFSYQGIVDGLCVYRRHNIEEYVYHASNIAGLVRLEPHVSTHDKPYVYAIRNKITAACFGAPKDDFDLLMDEVDGVPHLYECYQDALKTIYAGKSCSIYTVHEEGFLSGVTGWDVELVCEHTVPVVQEERIGDLFEYIQCAAAHGECIIHSYSDEEVYQAMLSEEICERIRAFGLSEEDVKRDKRIASFWGK